MSGLSSRYFYPASSLDGIEQHLRPARDREDVLIADGGGGVDAVDHHVGLVLLST